MENAEKLQNENSDGVQQNAELNDDQITKKEAESPNDQVVEVAQESALEEEMAAETESSNGIAEKVEQEEASLPDAKGDSAAASEANESKAEEETVEQVVPEGSADNVVADEQPKESPSAEKEVPVAAEEGQSDQSSEVDSASQEEKELNENTSSEGLSEEEEEEVHEEEFDFEHADKAELLKQLKEVRNEEDYQRLDKILKAIKPRFDELYELEKNEALQRFVSEGNEADSFEYHSDEGDKEFIALYGVLKSKRNKHYKELQNQREDNLKKKERLLEQLREIVDGEESTQSINSVKELQAEWKKIGPVPGAQNKTLWANYNALLDRYYDHRSIYFELKDLDRKKNLEQKTELCEKAEALSAVEDLKTAIIQLNDLHEEYKHIGPVPKDDQEALWQRFKGASDAIYAKRKEYFDDLKGQFEANLVLKQELINEVNGFLSFTSDRITEWNGKTKEILELQKRWEAIGGVPKEKAKEINRGFWNTFKKFFAHKNQFFKQLEGQREDNLLKKNELIQRAEELKESSEWDSAAQRFKNLQAEWKELGPVPEKVRKETYEKFKAACDHFFNRRRDQNKEKFKAYDENLDLKLQICDQLESAGSKKAVDLDEVYDLIDNFTAIGFVPKNAIKKVKRRFDEAVSQILANEAVLEEDKAELSNHIEFGRLRNTPGGDRKIQRKENSIRRKISTLENDISTWNTNMEFFANSATADKLKADMQAKVAAAEKELAGLRSQLQSI